MSSLHLTISPSPNFGMNTHSVQRLTNQHEMPARWRTQDISLTADTRDNSSPKMSRGLNRLPRVEALTYPETCESSEDSGPTPRAPKLPTVALPGEEDGEDFSDDGSDSESDLGGGSVGTLDGDPEAILLSCLDDIFPKLFTIQN